MQQYLEYRVYISRPEKTVQCPIFVDNSYPIRAKHLGTIDNLYMGRKGKHIFLRTLHVCGEQLII